MNAAKGAKKILLVSTVELSRNGVFSVIKSIVQNMPSNEYIFDIVCNKYIASDVKQDLKNLVGNIYVLNRKRNPLLYAKQLRRIVEMNKYDIVHVHGNSPSMVIDLGAIKKAKCRKRIAHCHNTVNNHVFINAILRKRFNKLYTCAIACSKEAGWVFDNDFKVVPNCVNFAKYKFSRTERGRIRRDNKISQDEFVVGHVGLFNEQKNQARLIDIFCELKKITPKSKLLMVCGDDFIPNQINEKIKEKKISEDVIILSSRADVNNILSAMDVFVFPSLYEGFGTAILEAQSTGLPCIASSVVPESTNVTGKVKYLSLDDRDSRWAVEINKKADRGSIEKRSSAYLILKKSRYDISNIYNLYKEIYA